MILHLSGAWKEPKTKCPTTGTHMSTGTPTSSPLKEQKQIRVYTARSPCFVQSYSHFAPYHHRQLHSKNSTNAVKRAREITRLCAACSPWDHSAVSCASPSSYTSSNNGFGKPSRRCDCCSPPSHFVDHSWGMDGHY